MENFQLGIEKLERRIDEAVMLGERLKYTINRTRGLTDYESYIERYMSEIYSIKSVLDILYQYNFVSERYYDTCLRKIYEARPTEPE